MMNKSIDEKFLKWLEVNKDYIIDSWMSLVRIPSVKAEAKSYAPFGESCAMALNEAIGLFDSVNHTTTSIYNDKGYALAEYGSGNKMIGIFSHSDVVPAGDGWIYTEPFKPVIIDGSLIGRGCEDNKSGIVAALCLVKFLSECNIDVKSKIQVFIGSDEECGMSDLKAYLSEHRMPDLSFVPDADFPCSIGEKGIYHFWVKSKKTFSDILDLSGGEAANIVLDKVDAKVKFSEKLFSELESLVKENENVTVENDQEYIYLRSDGISKHASIPEGSLNAALVLFEVLADCEELCSNDRMILKSASQLISDNYGKGIGVTNNDPVFGKMTSVNGICKTDGGKLCMSFDVRYGDTLNALELEQTSEKVISENGFSVYDKDNSPGFSIDKNSEIPEILENIFNEVTGLNMKRVVMSGGTYARRLDNAFSIGTSVITANRKDSVLKMPDGHGGMHQRDEKIDIEAFFEAVRILIHYVLECDKIINA